MPLRQLWIFKFGCWASLVSAAVHLAGHVFFVQTPTNPAEAQVLDLARDYRFIFPGGAARSLMDFLDGYSLIFSVALATMGTLGLMVERRAPGDLELMLGVARTLAIGAAVMLAVSLMRFFIVPSLFLALMAVCFGVASVRK